MARPAFGLVRIEFGNLSFLWAAKVYPSRLPARPLLRSSGLRIAMAQTLDCSKMDYCRFAGTNALH